MISKKTLSTILLFGALGSAQLANADDTPKTPSIVLKKYTNSIGMTFVHLPAGSFMMGSTKFQTCGPVHHVILSSFWMGRDLVTNQQFEHYKNRGRPPESLGDKQPITRISYSDAVAFCKWLSVQDHHVYRLPTEAEWEYAARGGLVQKDYPWGDTDPGGRACFTEPWSTYTIYTTTTKIESFPPNGYGLYDMAGDVNQWTSDWYDENYYSHSPERNPAGPPKSTDDSRVERGGAYSTGIDFIKVWMRGMGDNSEKPDLKQIHNSLDNDSSGLRIVMVR